MVIGFRSRRQAVSMDARTRSSVLIVAIAFLLATALAGRAHACSQCMCGTPFPAGVLGGVVPMQFAYGLEERFLSKTSALDAGPGEEREREHRVAAFAMWRPLDRIALLARLPYNLKEITGAGAAAAEGTQTSRGVGDAELTVLAGLMRQAGGRATTLGVVLGGSAPTGSSDVRDAGGERLDAHLQPGTGAWSGTVGLNLTVGAGRGTWDASVLGRTSGTNAHGYRYGNAMLYNAGFTSRAWRGVQWLAQINGRSAARDRFEDGSAGASTGGMVTYVAPGVRWRFGPGLIVDGAVQVPAIQRLFDDQHEHATGRLSLSIGR